MSEQKPIPDSQLQDLKEKAEKATKGPYKMRIDDTGGSFTGWPSIELLPEADKTLIHRAGFKQEYWGDWSQKDAINNAAYIAACDPSTISTLVDEIVELRKDRNRLNYIFVNEPPSHVIEDPTERYDYLDQPLNNREDFDRVFPDAALQAGGKK